MASRPNLTQRRSTSSIQQLAKKDPVEDGEVEPSTSAPKRPTKQFVVHSRHHRVPSGRNLKKLAGTRSHSDLVALAQATALQQAQEQAKAAANHGTKAHSTSPVPPWERIKEKEARKESGGHELKKRSRSNPKRSASTPNAVSKKNQFEFASAPGSFDDSANQLAQAELDDAMNKDAAKNAYIGGSHGSLPQAQEGGHNGIPDVVNNVYPGPSVDESGRIRSPKAEGKKPEQPPMEHRRSTSEGRIRFAPAPVKSDITASATKLANGSDGTVQTPYMNTPLTPQPTLTPKSDNSAGKQPRPSPPFHMANHSTAIPPQISATNATAFHDPKRSVSSASSGPGPQPVTSRFITSSSSPGGALSSPSSVRNTPMKQRTTSISFESPPTPHATPPAHDSAPISTLTDHSSILRKPGTSNIGAGKHLPNRTQTKILLQRQISQAESEQEQQQRVLQQASQMGFQTHSRRGSLNVDATNGSVKLPREAVKEMDRINREYANVRRFVSPVGEAVVRMKGQAKNNRIPPQRKSMERDGSGPTSLGLSQSLGANVEGRKAASMAGVSGGGSRDDFGLAGRTGGMDEAKIRELLIHVWNRDEPGGNNLSSSN